VTSEHRDQRLAEAVTRIEVPPRSDTFMSDLLTRLDSVDAESETVALPSDAALASNRRGAGGSRRLWRLAARRKGSLLAAAVLAAALLAVVTLSGVPGVRDTQPPTATAADRLVAAIDAGLARVTSVQGVLVFDAPPVPGTTPPQEALFAATSAGDRLIDVRYKPDLAGAKRQYQAGLRALRKTRASYSKATYLAAVRDLRQQAMVETRTVLVSSTAARTTTWSFYSSDALTGRLARVKVFNLGWNNGLMVPNSMVEAQRVWTLATQLRSLVADNPTIAVTDTTYEGRAAKQVTVQASGGAPAWVATVDTQSGVTLAVRVLTSGSRSASDSAIVAFHIEHLQINQSLPPATFAVERGLHASSGSTAGVGGAPAPKIVVEDLTKGDPARRFYAPGDLARVAPGTEVVPTRVPAGYRLAQLTRYGDDRNRPVLLVYRRGMSEFLVSSYALSGSNYSPSPDTRVAISAFHRMTWPDRSEGDEFVRIKGGVLAGSPAVLYAGTDGHASLIAWTDTREVSLQGDLSRAELLAVAGSLRPLKAGTWGGSPADLASLLAVLGALATGVVTLVVWVAARRRCGGTDRPRGAILFWPLVGLGLVVVGAAMSWHALLHNGTGFAVRGWSEPLGRWVIASAVMAVVCAAWRQLATNRRRTAGAKLSAVLLALAAMAGAVLALAYLPIEARFTVSTANESLSTAPSEIWLVRIFSSQFSPSATTGLFVSILGALFLLVGVVMMRRQNQS
jgi:hypothetical protein